MSATVNGRATETVRLDELTILDETSPREGGLRRDRVDMFATIYAESGPDAAPPITVAKSADGETLYLVGGRHRVAGGRDAGLDELPAIVTALSPGADPILAILKQAAEEDSRSPLPLTTPERRAVVRMVYRLDPSISKKELARIVGSTESFVTNALDDNYVQQIAKSGRSSGHEEYAREAAKKIATGVLHLQRRGVFDLRGLLSTMPDLVADEFDDAFGDQAYARLEWLHETIGTALDNYEHTEEVA